MNADKEKLLHSNSGPSMNACAFNGVYILLKAVNKYCIIHCPHNLRKRLRVGKIKNTRQHVQERKNMYVKTQLHC